MMSRDLNGAVQDAYVGVGGQQGQRPADGLGRDGIVVAIETHVDSLAGAHRLDPIGVAEMERQRQQARLFFGEGLGHGACAIVGPTTLVRHLIPPHQRLPIALRQSGEDASRPEGIAYVSNGPFHPAFLIAGANLARTWHEVIVSRQFQQPRIEMNRVWLLWNDGQVLMNSTS